ncbi:hypothetical protein ACFLYQ_03270 [Chloroflexota bacterium]
MDKKRKIWMVVDHPQQFAIALGIIAGLKNAGFVFNLIISPHGYWQRVDIDRYRDRFESIHIFERPDYTAHPVRLLRMIFQIFRLKKEISRLNIAREDIIMGFSIFHYLENIVLSLHPHNYRIGVMPQAVYDECTRFMDKRIYFTPPEGLLTTCLVEPLTGLYRTYCMRERKNPRTYWRIRYRKLITEVFDKVIVLGIFADDEKQPADEVYTMPFPYVMALTERKDKKGKGEARKIVWFGNNFGGGMWNITPGVYAEHVNKCLDSLRTKYGAEYHLVYRPHPVEKDEMKSLDLSMYDIEKDSMLSELYLYEDINDIYAVFSADSTSSRSAFDFFINSYVFLHTFPYNDAAIKHWHETMGNVPGSFFINDLSAVPERYIKSDDVDMAAKKCKDVLNKLLSVTGE